MKRNISRPERMNNLHLFEGWSLVAGTSQKVLIVTPQDGKINLKSSLVSHLLYIIRETLTGHTNTILFLRPTLRESSRKTWDLLAVRSPVHCQALVKCLERTVWGCRTPASVVWWVLREDSQEYFKSAWYRGGGGGTVPRPPPPNTRHNYDNNLRGFRGEDILHWVTLYHPANTWYFYNIFFVTTLLR